MNDLRTGPITLARDVDLDDSCQQSPEVSAALLGMLQPLVVKVFDSRIKSGEETTTYQELQTYGNLQPFRPRELELLPEGERAWKWHALYSDRSLSLKESDEIEIKGKGYRVMKDADWSAYGYHRYDVVEGYSRAR